ncbi:MAG: two-component system, NtrC family, response regulator AtoC [Acidobacteriota bacterium]|jgi:CheY-like chemotaxis protein|nr:two-component system, NtrC family, response regulator AtoC [Acidobacteriota bacterium]
MIRLLPSKTRILLLDDDPSMQRLVSTLLKRAGHRVDVVSGGSEAIEQLEKNDYDGLLLDIMTPTDGGMTVIRHLKEQKPELLNRILLVTGSPESILKSVIDDVFGVVYKPFEGGQLLDAVKKLLEQ